MSLYRSFPGLLAPDEPAPASIDRPEGASPFLILCDHAGRRIPAALGTLGLSEADLARHIAWDIGAAAVSDRLGAALDAAVIKQAYSRLVIDCNRAPGHPTSIAPLSESTPIPGNQAVSQAEAAQREAEIFRPYHDLVAATLAERRRHQRPTVILAMHSFTPVYQGEARPWHVGVLYDRKPALSLALLAWLRAEPELVVGENEPYQLSQLSDYTVPVHAERNGLPCTELEIRQDLIEAPEGQEWWAALLARALVAALASCV
jgi:predicted N-formylglutamate amidohydrolase